MCQLLLKEMFGYWEDISVAPGLSDFQGHRGFMCHVRKYKNRRAEAEALAICNARKCRLGHESCWDAGAVEMLEF